MQAPKFYVHRENKKIFEVLYWLKDESGKKALSETHRRILEYVGSFDPKAGCFASRHKINGMTSQTSKKTFSYNMKYLLSIGAIMEAKNDSGRVLRLAVPAEPVKSQRDFRIAQGLSNYRYAEGSFFCETEGNNVPFSVEQCSEKTEQCSDGSEHCSCIKENRTESTIDFEKTDLLPKALPRSCSELDFEPVGTGVERPASRAMGAGNDRPPSDGIRHREQQKLTSLSEREEIQGQEPEAFSEPVRISRKNKRRRPKNQAERQETAKKDILAEHIANPLGVMDNRPRRLCPKTARDISADRAVTVSQLYKHVLRLYANALGPGILEGMLPTDRKAMTSRFGDLIQKFVEYCEGWEPNYRDLAEYFEWFLDPQRLSKVLDASKYASGNKGYVHFMQAYGAVYIRRFYDDIVRKRRESPKIPVGEKAAALNEKAEMLDKAFSDLKAAEETANDRSFAFAMVEHGYALAAQFLHEEHGLTDSECRQRIIAVMASFIRSSSSAANAVEHLRIGTRRTASLKFLLYDDSVWYECEEKTKDLVDVAIQQSGVSL